MIGFRAHRVSAVLAFGLLVLAFGAGAWSRAATRSDQGPPPPEVLAVSSSEVRHLTVESGAQKVSFVRGRDGDWAGEAGAPAPATTLISDAEARLFPLRAYRALTGDAQTDFGLGSPEIVLTVDDTAQREHRVRFGAASFTGGGVYVLRDDNPKRVFLVPRRTIEDLRSVLAGRAVAVENDVPARIREINKKQAAAESDNVSWWLRQVLNAGTRPSEREP